MSATPDETTQLLLDYYREEARWLTEALCEVTRHTPANVDLVEGVGTVAVPIASIQKARSLVRRKILGGGIEK